MGRRVRNFVLAIGAALTVLIAALWATVTVQNPGPRGKIIIATGGSDGAFHEMAERYKKDLARYGVDLELRPKVEGIDTLKALFPQYKAEFKTFDESTADIEAGFAKGGFSASLYGRLATEREQVWHQRQVDSLRSVGRLFYEPLWVFSRAGEPLKSLGDLKGKRIFVGSPVSGTRRIASHLLKANGVDQTNSTIIEREFPADAGPIDARTADAVMLILPAESPKIQQLLRNPKLKLMDFAAEAEAYTSRFPSLTKIILRQGAIEFNPDTPAADITLLASSAALVVRTSLNPSLQALLANAVIRNPKPGFDRTGEPILFHKVGQFPHINDPEFEVTPGVTQVYKNGSLPVLLRATAQMNAVLGLPFWPAAFLNEHGTQTVLLLIPLISILVPLFHYLPLLYKWSVRRRLLAWYRRLKALETSLDVDPSDAHLAEKRAELDRIDAMVTRLRVPLPFSDQIYDLRAHIDLVRRRLAPKVPGPLRTAAE
jgi:NMT1 family protein